MPAAQTARLYHRWLIFPMCQNKGGITVLGLDIAFRPGADMERARKLALYVEERYEMQKLKHPGTQGKAAVLTVLALAMADELMQMKTMQEQTSKRLECLLEKIGKSF